MLRTKNNIIKVLIAIKNNRKFVKELFKDDKNLEDLVKKYEVQIDTLEIVLLIMTNKNVFNQMVEIYEKEI